MSCIQMKKFIVFVIPFLMILIVLNSCTNEENFPLSPGDKKVQLDYYIESYKIADLGFDPQLKVVYEYNENGSLRKYTVFGYNPTTKSIEEQRYFVFSYTSNKVEYIKGYLPQVTDPYVEYAYQYFPIGDVSKIKEKNYSSGINSEADFTYTDNGTVKVLYTFSNGGAFGYELNYTGGNALTDKTTRASQLCSDGKYTYDKYKNPFKELGYVDYLFINQSANNNNMLTTTINYVGCAFPSFIPESYAYEYNSNGYPIAATTGYKNSVARSKKEFFYK